MLPAAFDPRRQQGARAKQSVALKATSKQQAASVDSGKISPSTDAFAHFITCSLQVVMPNAARSWVRTQRRDRC